MRRRQGLYVSSLVVAVGASIAWADAFTSPSQMQSPNDARKAVKMMEAGGKSLENAIQIAEQHTSGKAVSARVVMASHLQTDSSDRQTSADPRSGRAQDTEQAQTTGKTGAGEFRFVVTCLVDQKNLRDVVVDPQKGEVLSVNDANRRGERYARQQSFSDDRQYDRQDDRQYDRQRTALRDGNRRTPVDERYIEQNAWPADDAEDFGNTHPGWSRGGPSGITYNDDRDSSDSDRDGFRSPNRRMSGYDRDYRAQGGEDERFDSRYDDRRGQRHYTRDDRRNDNRPGQRRYDQDERDRSFDQYTDRRGSRDDYRNRSRNTYTSDRRLHSAGDVVLVSELIDAKVVNHRGEDVGEIKDAALDWANGRVAYAVLAHGGVLGIGEKKLAVPFGKVADLGDGKVRLSMTEEELEATEGFDDSNWPRHANQRWADDDTSYVRQTDSSSSRAGRIYKASEIIGKTLHDEQGEEFGEIADVVIDASSGRIFNVIVDRDDEGRVLVPFEVVDMNDDKPVLTLTQRELEEDGRTFARSSYRDADHRR